MSTPHLKNRLEDAVSRISRFYFSMGTPSKRVAQRMACQTVGRCCIYTIQSGRIQGGGNGLQVMAGRGDSGVGGFTCGGCMSQCVWGGG